MPREQAPRSQALHMEGCLFCRQHDGGFEAEEHIIPYALGNRELVLQPGVVCDRCNHGPLQKADQAISTFPMIEMLRTERGLGTRNNKPLVLSMNGTRLWWEAPGELRVIPAREGVSTQTGPSSGTLKLTSAKPIPARTFKRMTCAVWKAGLEDLYRREGAAVAFDAKFDHVRETVIGKRSSPGWCYCPKESKPHDGVALHTLPFAAAGRDRMLVCLDVFGVAFVSDLLAVDLHRDEIKPPVSANIWTFDGLG